MAPQPVTRPLSRVPALGRGLRQTLGAMATYFVDPARSEVTAVTRPMLGDRSGPWTLDVTGTVEVVDDQPSGKIALSFTGDEVRDQRAATEIDLAGTGPELGPDLEPGVPEGALVLRGRTSRPAGLFGLAGPPLINPTVQLRWRLVLVPARPVDLDLTTHQIGSSIYIGSPL